jgi:hypothetical protein
LCGGFPQGVHHSEPIFMKKYNYLVKLKIVDRRINKTILKETFFATGFYQILSSIHGILEELFKEEE